MNHKEWLMLNFTLPKEPSRVRVSVWRKLKKCGAVSIGSMWVLPVSDYHISIFNEISNEITQN
ncbi:MAG: Chromate resistance protein ChrB, partial [Dehalobacterium sp.]